MNSELRPHQVQAMALLRQSLGSGHKRVVVQAPTGFGKTILSAAIVEGALRKGNRVIFCVPSLSLIDQTVMAFHREGITEVGVIQANHELTNYSKPVQVCSIQTIQRRKQIPHADIVVVDECHVLFKFYAEWMEMWNQIPFVGLSATPWTVGLGKLYQDLVIASTTMDLIDQGYLSPFRVYAPSHPDLSGVRTVAGDYHEGDLGEAMDKDALVADIVETWLKLGEMRPTLCFGVNRVHAKHMQQRFESVGVPTGYIDSYTPPQEREEVRKRFASGEFKLVCNVGCLTTGVDWDVRCIILARPTKSEMLYTQIIGRGLRTADGKDDCLILDHSDTTIRLGFVTDINHERLKDGTKGDKEVKKREALPKECAKCAFLKPPKTHACPACGFKPEPVNEIQESSGELIELGDHKKKKKSNKEWTPSEKMTFFGELKALGKHYGYKEGWAANKYRDRFGVWPNAYSDAPLVAPSMATQSWVRSTQIKWAKGRPK